MSDKSISNVQVLREQIDESLPRIAAELRADVVTAFVYDEATTSFHLPTGCGLRDPDTFGAPLMLPRSGRIASKIAEKRKWIIASEQAEDSPIDWLFVRREGIRAAAGFPVVDGERAVGVLFVSYRTPHKFELEEESRIERAAQQLAALIRTADPWDELRRLSQQESPEIDRTLQAILDPACDTMNLPTIIWRLQPDRERFAPVAHFGLTNLYWQKTKEGVSRNSWLGEAATGSSTGTLTILGTSSRFPFAETAAKAGFVSSLCIPILVRGRLQGLS